MSKYIMFSSIGHVIENRETKEIITHPVVIIAGKSGYIVDEITLIHSKEDNNEKTIENIQNIKKILSPFNIRVEDKGYKMEEFDQNYYELAMEIIKKVKLNPDHDILIDLSTARTAIKLALSRSAYLAYDLLRKEQDKIKRIPTITCAMLPVGFDKPITYDVNKDILPNKREGMVLKVLKNISGMRSQAQILKELTEGERVLNWSQSQVSKALGGLKKLDMLHDSKANNFTQKGENVYKMLSMFDN